MLQDFAHEHSSLNYITNSKNIFNCIQNLFNIIISNSIKQKKSNCIVVGANSVRPRYRAISQKIECINIIFHILMNTKKLEIKKEKC